MLICHDCQRLYVLRFPVLWLYSVYAALTNHEVILMVIGDVGEQLLLFGAESKVKFISFMENIGNRIDFFIFIEIIERLMNDFNCIRLYRIPWETEGQ